ncbi:MAG TPA: TonB-dependent receptor, partial [Kofleriaceae bacterium]
ADDHVPASLRMRAKPSDGSAWSPMRWARRIAQVSPAGGPPGSIPDPASGPDPAPPNGDPSAQGHPPAPTIPVTGTLIHREQVDSPSPVWVVDREMLASAGLPNVGDVLQKLPVQGNAVNAQNDVGDGSTRINLRGLGTARTLVLLNGRRVVPSGLGANSSVDLGTIPLAMIERVEVLKDGASAVYGSDAIAGVVNVITRTNMHGIEANAYNSTSNHADGTNYDLGLVAGYSWDRANITLSGGYQSQKPVMARDRDFSRQTYTYDYSCTADMQARGDCIQTRLSGYSTSPSGRLNTMPSGGPPLNPVGCNTRYCTADGMGGFRNFIGSTATDFGDTYNVETLSYLVTPSTRINLFSNGHYDITRNVHGFFEGQFNRRTSTQQLAEEPFSTRATGIVISADSFYNPFGQDVVDYDRRLVEVGPRTFHQEVSTTRLVVGLDGTIDEPLPGFKNWKWEVSYDYGHSDSTQVTHGDLSLSLLANALGPSFLDTQGAHCGTSPANEIAGCVPLDLLHPGSGHITPDAINYLAFTGMLSGFNEQHTALLQASGKLLDLPNHAGISLAIGGDARLERGGQQPDALTAIGDTTGTAFQPIRGSYKTTESFGELSVVPIANGETLKWFEIDAAGRVYAYDTFGSGTTGKVSGLVRTLGGVAVRGSYGTAFRTPSISELFSAQVGSFPLLEDPCDTKPPSKPVQTPLPPMVAAQCLATGVPANSTFGTSQQRVKLGGNPALQPEKGTVGTAGIVYAPARGLDVTLDYWHIDIHDAITNLPAQTILSQCYQAGNDDFCNQIQRDPVTHGISQITALNQNVGGVTTSGLDFSAAYQYRNSLGMFRHALEGTYLFQYNVDTGTRDPSTMKEQILQGRGVYDLGVFPDLKFNLFTTWVHPSGFGAGFNVRFIDGFQECEFDDCNDPRNLRRDVSSYVTGDLFVTYRLKAGESTPSIAAGMNNVLNARPPAIYNGPVLNADESAYDFLGRQFYLRLSQRF